MKKKVYIASHILSCLLLFGQAIHRPYIIIQATLSTPDTKAIQNLSSGILLSTLGGSGLEMKWFGTYIWHGSNVARRDFRF